MIPDFAICHEYAEVAKIFVLAVVVRDEFYYFVYYIVFVLVRNIQEIINVKYESLVFVIFFKLIGHCYKNFNWLNTVSTFDVNQNLIIL